MLSHYLLDTIIKVMKFLKAFVSVEGWMNDRYFGLNH